MKDYFDVTYPIIIMGDFNMKSITGLEHDYNAKLGKYMRDNFNFKQIVKEGHINLWISTWSLFYKWKHSVFYYLELFGQIIKL